MERIDNSATYTVCRFDGVNAAGIYVGSLDHLYCVNERLKWREVVCEEMGGDTLEVLTLDEIAKQINTILITVIINGPFSGEILQYGNYSDSSWWRIGELDGYT